MRNTAIKSLAQTLMVLVMLISFSGQALTYTEMPCEMSQHSHQSMDHSAMMHHQEMGHTDIQSPTSNSEDCCNTECACPTGNCASATLIISDMSSLDVIELSEATSRQRVEQPNSISTLLFRPPIFS